MKKKTTFLTVAFSALSMVLFANSTTLTNVTCCPAECDFSWTGDHSDGNAEWCLQKWTGTVWQNIPGACGNTGGPTGSNSAYRLSGVGSGDQIKLTVTWANGDQGSQTTTVP